MFLSDAVKEYIVKKKKGLYGSNELLLIVGVIKLMFIVQKVCKAANNQIESLPDTISIFWRTHLKEVDFSENALKELPSYIFELEVRKSNQCQAVSPEKLGERNRLSFFRRTISFLCFQC